MKLDEQNTIIEELDNLLEAEKAALLQGNLEQVTSILETKEALIDKLNALQKASLEGIDEQSLAAVHGKIQRNQTLIRSSLEGIRAVADRISGLRRVRQGLETYDQSGKKTQSSTTTSASVEKRA